MRLVPTLSTAVLLGALAAPVAAADLITVPIQSSAVAVPVADETAFDWSGFYAGVYGVMQLSDDWDFQYGIGLNAGVNAQLDFFLVGAEVAIHGLVGDTLNTTYGQILGRAGVVLTEDVLLYAAAGYGIDLGAPIEEDLLVGGGLEWAATDDFSVRAQYLHGFPLEGGNPKDQVTLGASFHF